MVQVVTMDTNRLRREEPDIVLKGEAGCLVGEKASGDQGAEGVDQKD